MMFYQYSCMDREMDNVTVPGEGIPPQEVSSETHQLSSTAVDRKWRSLRGRLGRLWDSATILYGHLHRLTFAFCELHIFERFILVIVLLNTVRLVAQTFDSVTVVEGWNLSVIDCIFLAIYLAEFLMKFFVWGRAFFKNAWNVLDFIILLTSLIDFLLPLIQSAHSFQGGSASTAFRILRIMKSIRVIRSLRVLRTIRFVNSLQTLITICLQSLQSLGTILMMMLTVLFMFAMIFRQVFYDSDPDRFGNLFQSCLTLFQVLTLDDWCLIYFTSRDNGSGYIIIFLVLYIVVQYIILLNLFVAVLIDNVLVRSMKTKTVQSVSLEEFQEDADLVKTTENGVEQTTTEQHGDEVEFSEDQLVDRYYEIVAKIKKLQGTYEAQARITNRLFDKAFGLKEDTQQAP
ncbi:cation channel sperm-associated protein 1-like [Amia ocellicauda]|uniref:cation channel sperm-associated protein 1-like n=1 Tax=Amia ocellicauda TaxID=2972642 RepID=UPI00346497FA